MKLSSIRLHGSTRGMIIPLVVFVLVGCAGAGEGAVKGAASGALAGAASGLISALVWGGDPGEYMARGATAGATVGAIGGAVQGSGQARAEKESKAAQEQRELEQFRRDIGNDAYDGAVALVECKHAVAIANAQVAEKSTNSNHALAGLWVEALSYADNQNASGMQSVGTEIIRWDREISDATQFQIELEKGHSELMDIRSEYRLSRTCGT
jgi:hypothetical protein